MRDGPNPKKASIALGDGGIQWTITPTNIMRQVEEEVQSPEFQERMAAMDAERMEALGRLNGLVVGAE